MPKVLILPNGYIVYFHSDESRPMEPVHVHIGRNLKDDAAKAWICDDGSCELSHNKGHVPEHELMKIMKTVSAFYKDIVKQWEDFFEIKAECKSPYKENHNAIVVQANKSPYQKKKVRTNQKSKKHNHETKANLSDSFEAGR